MRECGAASIVWGLLRGLWVLGFLWCEANSQIECGPRMNERRKERRMRRVKLAVVGSWLAFGSMLFISAPGAAQQKTELPHPTTLQELQQAMKDVLDKEHVPGAGVSLVANGQLFWCGGIGHAAIAPKRAVNCDTQFRLGST